MNKLLDFFLNHDHREIFKWNHYFEIYDRHFKKYRNKQIVVVEIGVSHGGSLQMWKHFFGKKAIIYGIDLNPQCKNFEEDQIKVLIGSQSDKNFLKEVKAKIPIIDVLIDDGGHTMEQQIITFEELFETVSTGGIYLCEDLHTSYWEEYGGGYKNPSSYLEYSKNFIDYINAYHFRNSSLPLNKYTTSMFSLHYYDSVLVVEKRKLEKPFALKCGKKSLV